MARFIAKTRDNDMIKVYYDVKEIFVDLVDCTSMDELAKQHVDDYKSKGSADVNYGWILEAFHEEILDKPLKDTYVEYIPQVESSIANNEYEGYSAFILEYYIDDSEDFAYEQLVITSEGNEDQLISEFLEEVAYNDVITIMRHKAQIIL